jgi:hypothetical protein
MLLNQILADIKTAMKAREKSKLATLRSLHSDVKNEGINKGVDLTDDVVISVLAKNLKQQKDAHSQFDAAGRQDLVTDAQAKIDVYQAYMPQQMDESEIRTLVEAVVFKLGASSPKDMGKVMGALQPQVKGKADGKLVSTIVKESLAH